MFFEREFWAAVISRIDYFYKRTFFFGLALFLCGCWSGVEGFRMRVVATFWGLCLRSRRLDCSGTARVDHSQRWSGEHVVSRVLGVGLV